MEIVYDSLAVIFFMLFVFIGGSEGISILSNFVFGGLSFAACCLFVKLSDRCTKKKADKLLKKLNHTNAA